MELLVAGLAVYKLIQFLDSLLPKEPMPWVNLTASIAAGYGAAAVAGLDDIWISGLSVATVAGATHALLRLATLVGDMAQRKSLR
jgi:hypothetical protein